MKFALQEKLTDRIFKSPVGLNFRSILFLSAVCPLKRCKNLAKNKIIVFFLTVKYLILRGLQTFIENLQKNLRNFHFSERDYNGLYPSGSESQVIIEIVGELIGIL